MPSRPPAVVPRHVAIIMDGNGRWAEARGLPRSAGHKAGIDALRRTVRAASDAGIQVLSVFAFSTENWTRPKREIMFLFDLLNRFIRQDVAELHASGVQIRIIGARADLDPKIVKQIDYAEKLTAANDKLTLVVAFNYGAKQELAKAAGLLAAQVAAGRLKVDEITADHLEANLDTVGLPPVDLLIRTGGDQRVSNFMLWQSAYAELHFATAFWPDFDSVALSRALQDFAARDRRFGGLKAQSA